MQDEAQPFSGSIRREQGATSFEAVVELIDCEALLEAK